MTPAALTLIIGLIEEAIKIEPSIAAELKAIFNNASPSPADWMALKAKIQGQTFEQLAPDAVTETPAPTASPT
jgi:hypothetical protein